ncbi:MAG TPA: response regulator, partial [Candidatus Ozemobacteraceae bacterium]|nr:response regulator [Candidatus Ozemobacteraceae bacterium]
NPTNQVVAQILCRRLGIMLDLAQNGREAVEAVRTREYDLVLMDCQMPECDGYEATREIRLLPGPKAQIPIIAMTAHTMETDRQRCLAAGMNAFVPKPVTLESLSGVLKDWLSKQAPEAEVIPRSSGEIAKTESSEIWNPQPFLDTLQGDRETAAMALEVFLAEFPKQLTDLRKALDDKDLTRVRRSAHRLKGSALELQIVRLRELALQIEKGPDDLVGLENLYAQLEKSFQTFRDQAAQHSFFS